jgi:hypothetical protein
MRPVFTLMGLVFIQFLSPLSNTSLFAQQVLFSDSIGNWENSNYCTVAGVLHNKYIAVESTPTSSPKYILLDSLCGFVQSASVDIIPPLGFIKASITEETQSWNMLWQTASNQYWYLHKTFFSGPDCRDMQSEVIDSTDLREIINKPGYFVIESAGHHYQCLFRKILNATDKELHYDLIIVTNNNGKIRKGRLIIPFNTDLDANTEPVIDDAGNVFMAVFDHPLNFRYSSAIRLFEFRTPDGQIEYPPIVSREKKPSNLIIEPNQFNNRVLLMSLYTDFYTKHIDGVLGTLVNKTDRNSDSIFSFVFTRELKRQINKHINGVGADDLMNFFELRECTTNAEKGVTFLLELSHNAYSGFNSSSWLNRSSNRGLNSVDNYSVQQGAAFVTGRSGRRGGRYSSNDVYNNAQRASANNNDNSLSSFSSGNDVASINFNNIPVQYISLMGSFDGNFRLTNKKIIENRLTVDIGFMPPFNSLKNGSLQQFVYDCYARKPKLKQVRASFLNDLLWENPQALICKEVVLLNHPGLYRGNSFLISFYKNPVNNSYGLAKLNW